MQDLFEDWFKYATLCYWEVGGLGFDSYGTLLAYAKSRCQTLGLDWRHEAELKDQLALEE